MSHINAAHSLPLPAIYKTPEACKWDALGFEWILPHQREFDAVHDAIAERYPYLHLDYLGGPNCAVGHVECFKSEEIEYVGELLLKHIIPGATVKRITKNVGERIEVIQLEDPPEAMLDKLRPGRNNPIRPVDCSRTRTMAENRAKVLMVIESMDGASAVQVKKAIKTTWKIKTIRWHLSQLRKRHLVAPMRIGKAVYWNITETGQAFLESMR